MLNTSHLRGNVNSLSGIIECEFERRPPIYFPGEEVRGKIFFRALTAKFSISGKIILNFTFKFNVIVLVSILGLNSRLIGVEAVNFGNDFRGTTKAFLVLEYHALLTTSEDPGKYYLRNHSTYATLATHLFLRTFRGLFVSVCVPNPTRESPVLFGSIWVHSLLC